MTSSKMTSSKTVVHISPHWWLESSGGATRGAMWLHQALLANGVDSHYVCLRKFSDDGCQVHEFLRGVARHLFLTLTKLLRGVWKLSPRRRSTEINLVPLFGLERLLAKLHPDVIHVHYLNGGMMSFGQLGRLRKVFPNVRIVVHLHDFFMINAIAPYPESDRRYLDGFLKDNSSWLERWLFARKRRAIQALSAPVANGCDRPLAFVGPSEWAADCCRRSIIGKGVPAYAIPYVISPCFAYDASLRREHHKFVILYGAFGGRKNPSKGFDDLARALVLLPQAVKEDMELRIFGEEAEPCETGGAFRRAS